VRSTSRLRRRLAFHLGWGGFLHYLRFFKLLVVNPHDPLTFERNQWLGKYPKARAWFLVKADQTVVLLGRGNLLDNGQDPVLLHGGLEIRLLVWRGPQGHRFRAPACLDNLGEPNRGLGNFHDGNKPRPGAF
jgi:hypothetical protein